MRDEQQEEEKDLPSLPKLICASDIARDSIERAISESGDSIIKTGFPEFDEMLGGGFRNGRLYTLGAMTSLGKTTLCLNIVDNIASQKRNVLFFSFEMEIGEMIAKSIARQTFLYHWNDGLASSAIEIIDCKDKSILKDKANVQRDALTHYEETIANNVFFAEGTGYMGIENIRESINLFLDTNPDQQTPLVVIDYLQLIAPESKNFSEKQNIDRNISNLKRIARDLRTPILVISSFNRQSYLNEVSFESFKGSGDIEYASDVNIAIQLYVDGRESWTDKTPTFKEKIALINEAKQLEPRKVEIVVLKNRMYKSHVSAVFDYYAKYDTFEYNGKIPAKEVKSFVSLRANTTGRFRKSRKNDSE